jgi:lysylphosphatidylglycerol synthetase-like protein (DUF2156 family)
VAVEHLFLLVLLAAVLVEFCLQGNQKIPFACSWLPGRSNFHITSIICAALVLQLALRGAGIERESLQNPWQFVLICTILAVIFGVARWRTSHAARSESTLLQFDGLPAWQMVSLNLSKDGGLPG